MNDTIPFGRWLKERRQSLDMTQDRLADRVGCALSTVEKIERGLRRPSHQIARRIAEELRIPPEEQAAFVEWARAAPVATAPATPEGEGRPKISPGNLPAPATALIGREEELDETRMLLRGQEVRLLTLLGPPGIGKTRLSLALAESLMDDYADGVWFVPLAAISDPDLVASTIAKVLGLQEGPNLTVSEGLQAYLREKQMLFVLDNFEQIISAAPLVSDLLAASPGLKVIVTSRTALDIYGEHHYDVRPLDLPDLANLPLDGALQRYSAVALFVKRAQAVAPHFTVTDENGTAIVEICARLDGLPLAIELAAARSRLFDPLSILRRLDRRLPLLSGGPRDRTPRQQSLRGAINWSYDLLNDAEKALFRRLSVFVGGCTLETIDESRFWLSNFGAEAGPVHEKASPYGQAPTAEDLVISLVGKSLLQRHDVGEERRFIMLETVREYAAEQLEASGEVGEARDSHARYYLALAASAEPQLKGALQKVWLDRLEAEHDNFRAVMSRALERGNAEIILRLGASLWRFWWMRGYTREGYSWMEKALAAGGEVEPAVLASALHAAAALIHELGDYEQAELLYNKSIALQRELGEKRGLAMALCNLGSVHWSRGDYEAARSLYEESLGLYEEVGDKWGISVTLTNLGVVASAQRDYEEARRIQEKNLAIKRDLQDKAGIAITLNNIGVLAQYVEDYARARDFYVESLTIRREIVGKGGLAISLVNLGAVAFQLGDHATAYACCVESLELRSELGDRHGAAFVLEELASFASAEGEPSVAARLYGASEAIREEVGSPLSPAERVRYDANVSKARSATEEAAFDAAWEEGRALPLKEVLEYAMAFATGANEGR
jgi:predicted ATPase/DNA-binding XRE family transcriptional regulator